MDNKRLYKKLSTFFWFALATAPLWISFFMTIFSYFGYELTVYNNNFNNQFTNVLNAQFGYGTSFNNWLFSFIYTPIENIFTLLGLQESVLAMCSTWFIQVYILELLIDIFIWLPKFIHNLIEKWSGV